MADQTRTILNHYNIATPFPTEWPAEKDESDASDTEKSSKAFMNPLVRRSKSRYSVLDRSGSDRRSLVPGSQKTRDGLENLVQKDESDPLGGSESVVRVLRQKGLPVEEDQRLREHLDTSGRPTLRGKREPLSPVVDNFHSGSFPFASSFGNSYNSSDAGSRIPISVN